MMMMTNIKLCELLGVSLMASIQPKLLQKISLAPNT